MLKACTKHDNKYTFILANATKQSRKAHFMPIEEQKNLTSETHKIRSMLLKDMKAIILSKKENQIISSISSRETKLLLILLVRLTK